MKYNINQKVICNNKKCLVIATKKSPYKPTIDPYHRKEIYPENDYLLFILKNIETEEYLGTFDVLESQIEYDKWN